MGADAVIQMVFQLLTTSLGAARNAGILKDGDWLRYADAGLSMAQKAALIFRDLFKNPSKYDNATPEQIKAMLMPLTWEEIEKQAALEVMLEGPHHHPPPLDPNPPQA